MAADFFSLDTIFFKRLYVLIYVHLATRRVLLASCTAEPNQDWVTQQARNLCWKLQDEGIRLRFVIHDRDRKFAPQADRVFRAEGARVIITPLMAPRAKRPRRTLDRQLPAGVPRPDADSQPASPGGRAM